MFKQVAQPPGLKYVVKAVGEGFPCLAVTTGYHVTRGSWTHPIELIWERAGASGLDESSL